MQAKQIQQRLTRIERCVDDAATVCQNDQRVPEALRQALDELEKESDKAAHRLSQRQDETEMVEVVDRLEALGDRAMRACRDAGDLDPHLAEAVREAHDEISNLKHDLR